MSKLTIIKRPSETRGQTDLPWLQSRHSFSFGDFYDPEYVGFCHLRIINEDIVTAGNGFGMHPHHSMEILSFVVEGRLRHEDTLGNDRTIGAGEVQYLSAGSGIMHSEINGSDTEPIHFLQVWIEPDDPGGAPIYLDRDFGASFETEGLTLVASGDGREESIMMRQAANIWHGNLDAGSRLLVEPESGGRNFWVQVIDGDLELGDNQEFLLTGDGAALSSDSGFPVKANESSRFLVFEL